MKTYVVTQGWYDDYRIITATTDETLAKAIAAKFKDTDIETYEDPEQILKPCWRIRFDREGVVVETQNESSDSYAYTKRNECGFDAYQQVVVYVVADDLNTAIKIAAERRERFLEEQNNAT